MTIPAILSSLEDKMDDIFRPVKPFIPVIARTLLVSTFIEGKYLHDSLI
jgi:hypothetical protein